MPVPISLIVDDSCPFVHVFRWHWEDVHHHPPETRDGRRLLDEIPNAFLDRFCDVVEAHEMTGKFSVVPAPAALGDIVRGIEGHDPAETRDWIDTMKRRLTSRFDFCSEGITHNLAVNLETGSFYSQGESEWSQSQTRQTLTPYLVRQLQMLKEAGIDATGVTSPWVFGIEVEPEYVAAIVEAQRQVYGRSFSWYFLHMLYEPPNTLPWVAFRDGETVLVSIPATVNDVWWATIDSPRQDREWIEHLADDLLTRDGSAGKVRRVIDSGGWPILLTHWQSLFSNGIESGLALLDEVGRRVDRSLGGEVEWLTFSEIARRTSESATASGDAAFTHVRWPAAWRAPNPGSGHRP